jgi:hypothetical protein
MNNIWRTLRNRIMKDQQKPLPFGTTVSGNPTRVIILGLFCAWVIPRLTATEVEIEVQDQHDMSWKTFPHLFACSFKREGLILTGGLK